MRPFLLALTLLAGLLPAGTAQAGSVSVDEATGTLVFLGDAGPNDVDVFVSGSDADGYDVEVRDLGPAALSEDSERCTIESGSGDAVCRLDFAPRQRLLGGGGDDELQLNAANLVTSGHEIDGQEGDDKLQGTAGAETLTGGPGNDLLSSDGFESARRLPPGPNDVLEGGDGIDEVSYRTGDGRSYSLTLDGVANDGASGENDLIASDVENLTGSDGATNVLVGNDGPNALRGFRANDTLDGRGGGDELTGDAGDDVLVGGTGADRLAGDFGTDRLSGDDGNDVIEGQADADVLEGGAGDDALTGGSGDDRITGGAGRDSFQGDSSGGTDAGNDALFARDGVAEPIGCGPGADTAQLDADDLVSGGTEDACEQVDRATVAAPIVDGGGGGGDGGDPRTVPRPRVASSSLRTRANRIAVTVACPAGGPRCVGAVRIRTASKVRVGRRRTTAVLASGRYSIAAGASRTVRLKVGRTGRTVLRRTRRIRVRIELRPPGGTRPVAGRTLTLRR